MTRGYGVALLGAVMSLCLSAACTSRGPETTTRCTPGATIACPCGGAMATQTCLASGTFGECMCADAGPLDGAASDAPADERVVLEDGRVTGPPEFLSFGTNVMALTEGGSVTFTALLTDPDGVADVVGGVVRDSGSAAQYGAFVANGSPGSFTATVTWAQIHAVSAIQFTAPVTRSFVAEFFDAGGRRASRTVPLRLECEVGGACAGRCVDLAGSAANCGACGNACPSGSHCEAGACSCPVAGLIACGGTCINPRSDASHCGACGVVCPAGLACNAGECSCPVAGQMACGGACIDVTTDPNNCGGCGRVCPAAGSATRFSACQGGRCTVIADFPNLTDTPDTDCNALCGSRSRPGGPTYGCSTFCTAGQFRATDVPANTRAVAYQDLTCDRMPGYRVRLSACGETSPQNSAIGAMACVRTAAQCCCEVTF